MHSKRRWIWSGVVLALGAAALALASGCAKAPFMGGGALHVRLTATKDCNNCGRSSGNPLTFRVLQVTDPSLLTGMTLTQLWDKEQKLLGAGLLDRREAFIDPGQTQDLPIDRKPGARAIIVVGNFCSSHGSCWYHSQTLAAGGNVKLLAGADCFSVAK